MHCNTYLRLIRRIHNDNRRNSTGIGSCNTLQHTWLLQHTATHCNTYLRLICHIHNDNRGNGMGVDSQFNWKYLKNQTIVRGFTPNLTGNFSRISSMVFDSSLESLSQLYILKLYSWLLRNFQSNYRAASWLKPSLKSALEFLCLA